MFRVSGVSVFKCLGVWVFGCFGVLVLRVFGVSGGVLGRRGGVRGLVVGFNFGFGRTKTTRNVICSSILTPSRKMLKTGEKSMFGQKRRGSERIP